MKTLSIWKTLLCSVMMLAMGAAFTACSDSDEEDPTGTPTMELSATSLAFKNVPEGEQSFNIQMTGSGYWKITGDVDKMTVSPLTGRSSATVKVLPSETATDRTMTLTVTLYMQKYGVEAPVTSANVRITQSGNGGPVDPTKNTNVKAIRAKVDEWCPTKGATYTIAEDLVLTGIVVSDKDGGNTNARNVLLADNTTEPGCGIMIRAKKYPDQVRGHVVSVNLNGAVAQNYNGTMQVEFQEGGASGGAATFTVVDNGDNMPEAIEVTDIKTLINYQSQYVKVKAQAKEADFGKMFYAGSDNYCNYTFVTPTGASLPLQFSSYSKSWAGTIAIPEKSGYIKGCVGTYYGGNIAPQNADDVAGLTEPLFEVEGGGDNPVITDAIYYNNFDKEKAVKDGNYYPNVTATDCFKNEAGSGASAVTYDASSKTSVRPTMTSEGAAYGGSGVNAIFFGEDGGTFTIGNIAVSTQNLKLTFGVSKASGSAFTAVPAGEFTVALSADGTNWSNSINYTLSGEADAWNLGTADFTLPANTKTLYIKFTAAVKSVFRLDDVTLAAGNGGQQITFEGGEEPGPGPDPTPGDITPLSTVLALAEKATIPSNTIVEAVVISNAALNNLTSKKGAYVQDATGGLQLRFTADHSFKLGDKLRIDLSGIAKGAFGGAVQVSLANDKATVVSSGNAVEAKTVTIDDFLANKYEGQYVAIDEVQVSDLDLTKTWVFDNKHSSIAMTSKSGRSFVVFSSKYATYGTQTVAQGSGTIKGISAINNGVMQIIFSQESDFAGLTGARFDGTTPDPTISAASSLSFAAAGESKDLTYTAANLGENNVYAKIEGVDAAQFSVAAPANGKVTVTAAANEAEAAKNATLVLYVAASEGGAAVVSTNVALSQAGKPSQGGGDAKTLTISRSTIDTSAWTVNSYGSQNTSNLDTYMKWSISGIDFIGAKLCLPTAGKEYDLVNAFQGQGNASDGAKTCRLGNTVSMGKIKKITVVSYGTTYEPNFNLTVGAEQIVGTTIPSSMVGAADMDQNVEALSEPALKKYTNVYVPTTDAGFFAIYKNTTGALYFSEIIVEYE